MWFTVAVLAFLATSGNAYTLTRNYNASNFFSEFAFFTDADPTGGFVQYVSQTEAESSGLAKIIDDQIYLGVDSTTVIDSTTAGAGRNSVRLQSLQTFSNGILIADFARLPHNTCGTWPAYWTINNDANPYGEIDLVEGINDQDYNDVTLYTSNDCTLSGGDQSGTNVRTDCNLNSGSGCGVSGDSTSYGSGFNAQGGGVYVLYLEESLKVWLFLRDHIPADITNGNPDPSRWGTPLLDFGSQTGCSVAQNFITQMIIFNIDFCGANAGGEGWTTWTDCSSVTGVSTCEEYVAANPGVFADSYFLINSVKLYQ